MLWEAHDRAHWALCPGLVLAEWPATCILICQSQFMRKPAPRAGPTQFALAGVAIGIIREKLKSAKRTYWI